MGVDITMIRVDKENKVQPWDFFDGCRNSEWFDNISGRAVYDTTYDSFPSEYISAEEFATATGKDIEFVKYSYDFRKVNVGDFKKWVETAQPQRKGGYFTDYQRWEMEVKGYIPEDPFTYLPEDAPKDMRFSEYIDKHENSYWMYIYINEHNIPDTDTIYYCFDC